VESECSDIKRDAHAAGDLHYRAMGEFVRERTPAKRRRALDIAIGYRRALQWVIDCYRRLRPARDVTPQLDNITSYKHLVEHDIEILTNSNHLPTPE
jgi:hypothetical protein